MKRIITIIVLIGIIEMTIPLAPKANAQIGLSLGGPVFETNPVLIENAAGETVFRTITRIVVESLKRRLLTTIVDQIIGWIEGEGKPLFVTNWKSFLADAANIAVGDLAIELGMGSLCSPFGLQVQISVTRPPRFANYIACTLDDIVENIENFYDDFRQGGYIAYTELWQPQNNYYGSVLMAMQEKHRRVAGETEALVLEAVAGGGFLGTKRCDSTGRFCTITTPGAQVGALAARAIGSDIDYLVNAQDLEVYVGAISDAIINRLVRSGAEGLINLTTPAHQENANNGQCAGLRGRNLDDCLLLIKTKEMEFNRNKKSYIKHIDATLSPLQSGEESLTRAISYQTNLRNTLIDLRDCQLNKGLSGMVSTETDLRNAQIELNRLEKELNVNRRVTNPLLNSKTEINNLSTEDNATMNFYYNSVTPYLDAEAAITFQEAQEAQEREIKQKVDSKLPVVQQQLNACI